MSLRDRLLQSPSARRERARVEAWEEPGGSEVWVEVREFTARDRIWWRSHFWEPDIDPETGEQRKDPDSDRELIRPKNNWIVGLLFLSLYDPAKDERVFKPEDAESVLSLPASAYDKLLDPLAPLIDTALEINGLASDSAEEAANFTSPAASSEGVRLLFDDARMKEPRRPEGMAEKLAA